MNYKFDWSVLWTGQSGQWLLSGLITTLEKAKEDFQRDYVLKILERNNGNRTQTARDLGVDPRTIFRYLEKEPHAPGVEVPGTPRDTR